LAASNAAKRPEKKVISRFKVLALQL